jgi:eukaryotic-like serine/threonine-protein kinase
MDLTASSDAKGPLAGTPYAATELLGKGAMGAVFAAVHRELGSTVAVKLLVRAPHDETRAEERLRLEARALGRIESPYVVRVLDIGRTLNGRLYVVMEHLRGRTLEEEVQFRGPLAPGEAIAVVVQMLRGLQAAHALGVIHRDIKPSNVFYTHPDPEGRRVAKILDFGLARVVKDESPVAGLALPTASGQILGTPRYLSPEQARGLPLDGRTDVYSAALVLYKLACGRGPFDDYKSAAEYLMAHASEPAPPPSRFLPALSPAFDALVLRALAKDREARFASAAAMVEALLDVEPARSALPLDTEPIATARTRGGTAPMAQVTERIVPSKKSVADLLPAPAAQAAVATEPLPRAAPATEPLPVAALAKAPAVPGGPTAPLPLVRAVERPRSDRLAAYGIAAGLAVLLLLLLVVLARSCA